MCKFLCNREHLVYIDGTLVHLIVPIGQQTRYGGRRKGECYQNKYFRYLSKLWLFNSSTKYVPLNIQLYEILFYNNK